MKKQSRDRRKWFRTLDAAIVQIMIKLSYEEICSIDFNRPELKKDEIKEWLQSLLDNP